MKRLHPFFIAAAGSAAVFGPLPAAAHDGHATASLLAGLTHPWLGWDHLLAMLAVGLWARQRTPAVRAGAAPITTGALPLVFALAVAAGLATVQQGLALPAIEALVRTSLLALGALLLTGQALRTPLAVGILVLLGLFHGQAHGLALPATSAVWQFGVGLVFATLALHGLGLLAAAGLQRWRQAWLLRLAGAGVATAGMGALMTLAA